MRLSHVGKKGRYLSFIFVVFLSVLISMPQNILNINFTIDTYTEGSRELMLNGGDRPRKYASSPVKVYADVGETIYLGSNTGVINYSAPDGSSGTCTESGNLTNATQENAGPLPNSGGYNPCTLTVGAGQEGVWYIDFTTNNVTFWDVTVRDAGGTTIPGRAYMNRFVGNAAGFAKNINSSFYVQTNDCYTYKVDMNGLDPYVFQFYSNNKGIRDGSGNPTYQSGNSNTGVHNPESPDTATDITHKLFLSPPDQNMPATAPIADTEGTTWLYCDPINPTISNVEFVGIEGVQNQMGTSPLGGYINFDSDTSGLASSITLDLNDDGVLGNGNDRTLSLTSVNGTNSVFWDGLDGNGDVVNASSGVSFDLPLNLSFNGGEVHFPVWDAEGSGGMRITRLNGPNAPDPTVHWDDTNITITGNNDDGVASTPVGSEPNDGGGGNNPLLPSKSLAAGADSSVAGTHAWGKNGTAYDGDGDTFGNRRLIDTWAFVEIPPVNQTFTFDIVETDLEIVSKTIDPNTVFEVGETANFEIVVRNNGASDAEGAKIFDTFASEFGNIALVSCTPLGSATCEGETINGNDFEAEVNIPSGDTVTYNLSAEIVNLPNNDMLMNTAYVLRPADSTDPDATNPDNTPPLDPQAECDAAGVSDSCNNKKTAVLKPEPQIGIAKEISSSTINSDGTITATYDIVVENTGNITLSNVSITEDLAATFSGAGFVVDSTNSSDFTTNPNFNGAGDTTLLSSGQTLNVGEAVLVQVVVTVTPTVPAGNYSNSASVSASTPAGDIVQDQSQNGNDVDPDNDPNQDPTDNNDPTPFVEFVNLSGATKNVIDLNGGSVEPGDQLEYRISVENTGNVNATGVSISDTVDTDTVLDTSSISLSSCGSSFIDMSESSFLQLDDLDIEIGQTCEVVFVVTVANPVNQGTVIENSALINPGDEGGFGALPESPDLIIDGTPDLSASTKSFTDVNGNDLEPDDELEYILSISNTGNALGTGIDVEDTIDPNTNTLSNINLSNCGSSFSDSSSSTTLALTGIEVEVGVDCIVTYTVIVNNPLPPGIILSNDVLINAAVEGGPGAFPSTNTDPVSSTPNLNGATKTAIDLDGGTTRPGDRVEFTITVPNSGNANATSVRVEDVVPDYLLVDQSSLVVVSGCGNSFDTSASVSNIIDITNITIDTSTPCIITFETNVASPLDEGTELDNVAIIHPANEGGNGSVPAATPTLIVDATPDLSTSTKEVTDLNEGTLEPGDELEYVVTLINTGDGTATGVDIDDVIDPNTENINSIVFSNCGSDYDDRSTSSALNVLSLEISTLENCIITYRVSTKTPLDEGIVITNQINIAGADEGGVGATPSSSDLTVDATPDLSTSTKDVVDLNGGSVEPGDILQYTTNINNTGNGTATGVQVSDVVDTDTEITQSSVVIVNCGPNYVDATTLNELSISDLEVAPSSSCTIIFSVVVNSPLNENETIANTIDIQPPVEGGPGASPSSPELTVDATPELNVTKSHDKDTNIIAPGEIITYTVAIENTGNGAGTTGFTDVISSVVSDPSGFLYTNCGGGESDAFTDPNLTISSLVVEAGSTCQVSYQVTANSPLNSGTVISNSVDVAAASEGGNDPQPVASEDISVDATPNLSTSTKEVTDLNGDTVEPGDELEYVVTLINTGDGLGTTGIVDEIDGSLTLDQTSITTTDCGNIFTNSSDSDMVSFTFLEVAVGTNCVIEYTATVSTPLNEGTLIENTATILSSEEGGAGATPSAPGVTVDATPDLSLQKTDNDLDNSVTPGQLITYQVTIDNNGNGQATGVDLTDTVTGNVESVSNFVFDGCGSNYSNTSNGLDITVSDLEIEADSACTITYDILVATPGTEGALINNSADTGPANEGGNDPDSVSGDELGVDVTPDLSTSTKVVVDTNGETLEPGDTLEYTITIINTGDGTGTTNITDVIQTETQLDPTSLVVTGCGSGFTDNTGATEVQIDNLEVEVGTDCIIEYSVTIDPVLDEGVTISNEVFIDPANEGGDGANPSADDLGINATPNLEVAKTASTNTIEPGGVINYQITIGNTGNGGASGVDLVDTITSAVVDSISNIAFTGCGSNYIDNSTGLTLDLADLEIAVGVDCVVNYDVNIANPANEDETINNSVDVGEADEGGNNPDIVSAPEVMVDATPDLSTSTKDVFDVNGGEVELGDELAYTISIINTGNGQATTSIIDSIQADTTLVTDSLVLENCGSGYIDSSSVNEINIDQLVVEVGSDCIIRYSVTVNEVLNDGVTISNQAVISDPLEGGVGGSPASDDLQANVELVLTVNKTLYETHDNGASCASATEDLLIVDPLQQDRDYTFCFEVVNQSPVYMSSLSIEDVSLEIDETALTLLSGTTPLAPGASVVYYYEMTTNKSLDNEVIASAQPSDSSGNPLAFDEISASDTASLVVVFDPPFGVKTGTYEGGDIVRWNMVWINSSDNQANGVLITDDIPENLEFDGDLTCEADGTSVVLSCDYEDSSSLYPRGRVVVVADISPDGEGATDESNSDNEIVISFDTRLENNEPGTSVENQAMLQWDADGDGVMDFEVMTDDPSVSMGGAATIVTIPGSTLLRTGGDLLIRKIRSPYVIISTVSILIVVAGVCADKFKKQ